ncbi:MAG: EAL domain-containing protein [Alphaproteobacteria bacterium]
MTVFTLPFKPLGCKNCLEGKALGFDIRMAFQPIVDPATKTVFAYEALVRGADGSGAFEVLSRITDENRYVFDQTCRVKAIETATRLGLDSNLSINFLPNAVYRPETCIRATMQAAGEFGLPTDRIMFEVSESEHVGEPDHLLSIFNEYNKQGFITAIDDFGAGYAGLNLLTKFKPDVLKLDMQLCRGVSDNSDKRIITNGVVATAHALGIKVIAEGIEAVEDYAVLRSMGIDYFQGYLIARPQTEALPEPDFSGLQAAA